LNRFVTIIEAEKMSFLKKLRFFPCFAYQSLSLIPKYIPVATSATVKIKIACFIKIQQENYKIFSFTDELQIPLSET